jgi:phosphatidylserine/phosphatidylglycerophosphate/cardiolipin synthase-like enzyme
MRSTALLLLFSTHALAGAGSLSLHLNDPTDAARPEDNCKAAVCRVLLERIENASTTIDFAIYGLRSQTEILSALVAAQKRGVEVRGIVDHDIHGKSYYSSTPLLIESLGTVHTDYDHDRRELRNKRPYDPQFERCKRPAGFSGPLQCVSYDLGDQCLVVAAASREEITYQGDLMHNKFFVVDQQYVWTGSTNTSDSGTGGYNANMIALVDSKEVAGFYTAEFEQMWTEGKYHNDKVSSGKMTSELEDGTRVQVLFSPVDDPIKRAVRPALQAAKERIDIAVFFLTHKHIARDLIEAHRRGVEIRVIIDATAAKNGYTKHEVLRAAGIPVKVEAWGGKMHAKSAVIDGETIITGSMNWTSAGSAGNDENTLIIHSVDHARTYQRWFDKMWKSVPDRWLEGRPDPESRDSGTACFDGVDNDFDHLADEEEPGCGSSPPPMPELPPLRLISKKEGEGLIKGNVGRDGKKVYHLPGSPYYDRTQIVPDEGERYFCTEDEARTAGWRPAGR